MPPKQRITREMILEKAFAMFCREGMEVINARSVAKALACSTQPIFSYYSGMQELKATLDSKAQEIFEQEVFAAPKGENWLVDICGAYVRFACEQPHVFRHLYQSACADKARIAAYQPAIQELIGYIADKEGIDRTQAQALCKEVGIYAQGLASQGMVDGCADAAEKIAHVYSVFKASV